VEREFVLTALGVERLFLSVWCIASLQLVSFLAISVPLDSRYGMTYNHLLVLRYPNALPLHNLHILQPRQNLMLDSKLRRHGERRALLNLEWLVLESSLGALGAKIDGYWWATLRVHGQGEDDADPGIVGVGDGGAG
jgi:hypothetical protein